MDFWASYIPRELMLSAHKFYCFPSKKKKKSETPSVLGPENQEK